MKHLLPVQAFSQFFLVFLHFTDVFALDKGVLEFSVPMKCKNGEYFDTSSLSCVECDVQRNLVPSVDRLTCVCNKFSKITGFKNGHPICTLCDNNATVTSDGKDCILCKSINANKTCICPSNQLQIDRNLNGTLLDTMRCISCPKNTYPSLDKSVCLPCDSFSYNFHTNCDCPSVSHIRVHNYCLRKDDLTDWLDVRNTYLIHFNTESIDSYYFRSELQAAVYFCKKKDKSACAHLSNMCTLTLYTNGVACMLFMQTHLSPLWLFYDKHENVAVLNSKRISMKYSLMKHDSSGFLNFTFATFSLDGKLLSIDKPNLPCNFLKRVRFGVNFRKVCTITIENLLNAKVEFLSPYLTFVENEKILMHALPIFIKNINENTNEILHWQLVRKFFLVDNISGFKTFPNLTTNRFKKDNNLSILRYMKSLNIVINVQSGEDRGKIFPPLLIIEYDELTNDQIMKDIEIALDFEITFTSKDNNINYSLQISIGILSGLALIFSGIKTWSYCKRNYACTPSVTVILWFFVYAMGAVGNVIILSLIALCIYLFIFYKGQTVPYILLPDDTNENNVRIFTIIAFCFKFVEIIGLIYQYWNVSIFFIDWERPKTTYTQFQYDSPHSSLRKMYSKRFAVNDNEPTKTPSEIILAKRKKTRKSEGDDTPHRSSKSSTINQHETNFSTMCSASRVSFSNDRSLDDSHNSSVSIWRTYLVANQWLKLQTKRKTNIIFQLIVALSTFQVLKYYPWTLAIPELTAVELSDASDNFILYYAVYTFVYILIYSIQWLFSAVCYERYVKNWLKEFVDLCSITNISVFILPFNYYGFYIHGRSVHGFADVDLFTLIENLKKEENNLCAHRGLVPGTNDQTFILSLTESFKAIYDEFFNQDEKETNRFLKTDLSPTLHGKRSLGKREKLKHFLSEFVDHCYKDENYIIKELHFLEKLGDFLFLSAKEKSIFYIDNNYSFSQVSFYGNEWLLGTFEITTFAFIIVIYEDCMLACIVTVLLSITLIIIAQYNWRRNLSKKSLLDERFLI